MQTPLDVRDHAYLVRMIEFRTRRPYDESKLEIEKIAYDLWEKDGKQMEMNCLHYWVQAEATFLREFLLRQDWVR